MLVSGASGTSVTGVARGSRRGEDVAQQLDRVARVGPQRRASASRGRPCRRRRARGGRRPASSSSGPRGARGRPARRRGPAASSTMRVLRTTSSTGRCRRRRSRPAGRGRVQGGEEQGAGVVDAGVDVEDDRDRAWRSSWPAAYAVSAPRRRRVGSTDDRRLAAMPRPPPAARLARGTPVAAPCCHAAAAVRCRAPRPSRPPPRRRDLGVAALRTRRGRQHDAGRRGTSAPAPSSAGPTSASRDAASATAPRHPTRADACVRRRRRRPDPEQRPGQLLMVGLDANAPLARRSTRLVARPHLGGVIYLGGWDGADSGARRTSSTSQGLASADEPPAALGLLVAADQEGGEVQQLRGAGLQPDRRRPGRRPRLGAQRPDQAAHRLGRASCRPPGSTSTSRRSPTRCRPRSAAPTSRSASTTASSCQRPRDGRARMVGGVPRRDAAPAASWRRPSSTSPASGRIRGNTDVTATGITDATTTATTPTCEPFRDGHQGRRGPGHGRLGDLQPKLDPGTGAMFSKADRHRPAARPARLRRRRHHRRRRRGQGRCATCPSAQRATRFIAAGGDIVLTGNAGQDAPTMLGGHQPPTGVAADPGLRRQGARQSATAGGRPQDPTAAWPPAQAERADAGSGLDDSVTGIDESAGRPRSRRAPRPWPPSAAPSAATIAPLSVHSPGRGTRSVMPRRVAALLRPAPAAASWPRRRRRSAGASTPCSAQASTALRVSTSTTASWKLRRDVGDGHRLPGRARAPRPTARRRSSGPRRRSRSGAAPCRARW